MKILDKTIVRECYTCMLLFLHLLAYVHLIHFTILISAHLYSYMLDNAEPETEPDELMEQAPTETSTNPDLALGKPECIPLMIIDFSFKS
jgi:hypothetical protein